MRTTRGPIVCAGAPCRGAARLLALVAAIATPCRRAGSPGPTARRPARAEWHALTVPGGRGTLTSLGVPGTRERAAVMVELIRRLHFSVTSPAALEAAIEAATARSASGCFEAERRW